MNIEYEATFANQDKDEVRQKFKKAGAKLIQAEHLQKRTVFHLPRGNEIKGGWMRVRDEGDKITLSLKVVDGKKIEDQKEVCLEIDSYRQGELFLTAIGCQKKAYQENRREVWQLDGVKICLDEWPFLEPFVEIEGEAEEEVKKVCQKLGFDYGEALFCSTDQLYSDKYGIDKDSINNHTPEIVFDSKNPFVKPSL